MLCLLSSPVWAPQGQEPRPLPLTLPAALLLVLATEADWLSRERLALVFWPDATPADARHHVRITLHRSRALLAGWGAGDALQTERDRVRLVLASDMGRLRAAQASSDAALLSRLSPAQWLQGWRLPGHDGFAQWCDDTAQQLQADWLKASRHSQPGGRAHDLARRPDAPAHAAAAPPGRDELLHRLLASPAPALLLLGEPGAGKTTLLRAAWPQALCLRGLEGLQGMPYRPLLDALRPCLPDLARALREPSHPLRPYRLDLARMLPELAPDEPLPPLDALTASTRLVEALARAFESLTPVLLVDDLQWCDAASVEWLVMLAHSGRLRWRAAARQHELPPPLGEALQSLRRAVRLQDLQLLPLSRPALALACAKLWPGQAFNPARLDRLHMLSGGNAFLLGELVAAGLAGEDEATPLTVQERVRRLVQSRLQGLPEPARHAAEAAAVFVHPVPAAALRPLAGAASAAGQDGQVGTPPGNGHASDSACRWAQAREQATAAGLLTEVADGRIGCRHDLVRQSISAATPPDRRMALHRHAALWLATQIDAPAGADALAIAGHWRAAGEPQTALAWCHRGAEQQKSRGRFDEARALWRQVVDESTDAAQALRARLELAACDLFDDLARGKTALEAVLAQLGAVADAQQRLFIEGRALAALVDNRVFAGEIARAELHARRLRALLPALPVRERVDAVEVLIELAMRQPDIDTAWALLAQLRALAPQRPSLLSFEGQIHWFGGQIQAAHDALALLLSRHPDHCRSITVENDLAVMLQALGRIEEAEVMARRSLQSWAGVAHTETLSLLVLGLTLTSAGRHEEADAALLRALALAREQASAGFEAEAQVRRARLLLQCGRAKEAQAALAAATPLLAASPEPLRVSQLVLAQVLVAQALGAPAPAAALGRLQSVAKGSAHPLVQIRLARVEHVLAADANAAAQAAANMAERARRSGVQEALAEALLLQAQAAQSAEDAAAWAHEAQALAARLGLADLGRRVSAWRRAPAV